MKLTDFSPYPRTVEGEKVPIHVEIDDALPPTVSLELDVHYQQVDARPAQKTLLRDVPCQRIAMAAQGFKYRLEWTVDLKRDGLQEHLTRIDIKIPKHNVTSLSPRSIVVVGIEITNSDQLKRIMLHEFSTRERFDPSALHVYLSKLTVEQRKVLASSASASENRRGRLVIFISLYSPLQSKRRMCADWNKSGVGVFANATFSVFFCRDDVKLNVTSAQSTSPITLVCHTEYFYVCLGNPPTHAWLNPPKANSRAPGWYNGLRPNQWLAKTNLAPPKFLIAALQPSAKVSYGVIWNSIYEAATGNNIMPGNSVHGLINTRGCWMLFRNFNWPIEVRDKLDRIYRKVYRLADEKETNAVIAELKKKRPEGPEYDVEKPKAAPGQKPPDGPSSSFDKFRKYDRNWAYEWFFHEVVGIKYFSDSDYWGNKDSVNDYKVGGHEFLNTFPPDKVRKPSERPSSDLPPYNLPEEGSLAYHTFEYRDPNVKIGPNLFRENALGIKTASAFSVDMHRPLTPAERENCCWADVYFYKEDEVKDVEKLSAADALEALDK